MQNPYVENLIEMGYDRADCETVAVAGLDKTFPMNIHGRVYQTQEEYDSALHDFLNGMWNNPRFFRVTLRADFCMKTTTATYMINVTTDDENVISFYKTMPTRPMTSKGIKSQNNKLSQWVEKEYPNFTEYEITAL